MIVEVMIEKLKNGRWYYLTTGMKTLKPKDVFRMWFLGEDKWILHDDDKGRTSWVVASSPYVNKDGIWQVECE